MLSEDNKNLCWDVLAKYGTQNQRRMVIEECSELQKAVCKLFREPDSNEYYRNYIEELVDDDDNAIFGKVNNGFNENTLKTFGNKPVCDIYINKINYEGSFDNHIPGSVETLVIAYLKGANNTTYMKACELHDYIMQEFIENEEFQRLDNIVKETVISDSEFRIQPLNKKWGVVVAFQLTHTLY